MLLGCKGGGFRAAWGPTYVEGLTAKPPAVGQAASLYYYSRASLNPCDVLKRTTLTLKDGLFEEGDVCTDGDYNSEGEVCDEKPPPDCSNVDAPVAPSTASSVSRQ